MIPFTKPGKSEPWDVMATRAARLAIEDAGISCADVEQEYVAYLYADSAAGQSALYELGVTGIPIVNVNKADESGLTRRRFRGPAADASKVGVHPAEGRQRMASFTGL